MELVESKLGMDADFKTSGGHFDDRYSLQWIYSDFDMDDVETRKAGGSGSFS